MRTLACLLCALTAVAFLAAFSPAPTASDEEAITATALDYIEGWYTGDAARMERALHPELAKRIVMPGAEGRAMLQNMSAKELVDATRSGAGTRTPENLRRMDVQVLDIFENSASVRVTAADWVDYMHVGKVDGEWKIINVLWELTPEAKARMGR
jgi:hypothetical protein